MVVQYRKNWPVYFYMFGDCSTYVNITYPNNIVPHPSDYNSYYVDMLERKPHLYLPVKASTLDELKLEHPELFL